MRPAPPSRWRVVGQLGLACVVAELLAWAAWTSTYGRVAPEPRAIERGDLLPAGVGPGEIEMRGVPRGMVAPRPAEGRVIVFVGDSFTYGEGVGEDEAFPAVVGRRLSRPGAPVAAINLGHPGFDAVEELALLRSIGLSYQPDVVVWTLIVNDFAAPVLDPLVGGDDWIVDRTSVPELGPSAVLSLAWQTWHVHAVSRRVLAAYQAVGTTAPADDPALRAWLDGVAEVARVQAARGGRLVVAMFPLLVDLDAYPLAAAHTRVLSQIESAGAETLDLLPAFAGRDATRLWATPRDHHPNRAAHAIAAEAIADALGVVPRASGDACAGAAEGWDRAVCAAPEDPYVAMAWARTRRDPGVRRDQAATAVDLRLARVGAARAVHLALDETTRAEADTLLAESLGLPVYTPPSRSFDRTTRGHDAPAAP